MVLSNGEARLKEKDKRREMWREEGWREFGVEVNGENVKGIGKGT